METGSDWLESLTEFRDRFCGTGVSEYYYRDRKILQDWNVYVQRWVLQKRVFRQAYGNRSHTVMESRTKYGDKL